MATQSNDLESKAEQAIADHLATTLTTINFYTGVDDATQTLPMCIVSVDGGEESVLDTGNYDVNVTLTVVTAANASGALVTHRINCGAVRDLVNDEFVAGIIALGKNEVGSAAGFHVFGIFDRQLGQRQRGNMGDVDCYSSEFKFRMACCATDIT